MPRRRAPRSCGGGASCVSDRTQAMIRLYSLFLRAVIAAATIPDAHGGEISRQFPVAVEQPHVSCISCFRRVHYVAA